MIKTLVILCLLGCALSLPIENPQAGVYLLRDERVNNEDGSYRFAYETSDGQIREETSHVIQLADGQPALMVLGHFSFIGPDGIRYAVDYAADNNGFRPQGDHLPKVDGPLVVNPVSSTPPPIAHLPPNAIKSLVG